MTNGLHDVMALASSVARGGLTDDALVDYQRRRYRFIRTREAFTKALYDVLLGATPGTRGLRDGMFAYWRRSERSRAASTAVLCGEDERIATFVVEYLRVVGTAGVLRASTGVLQRDAAAAARDVSAVVGAAGDALRVALEKARSALALERTRAVADAPSSRVDDPWSPALSSV
jgi:hypothetical protein